MLRGPKHSKANLPKLRSRSSPVWLQCQDPSLLVSQPIEFRSEKLDSFPKPRNIFRSACFALRLWSLEYRLHTDFWGARSTGWLLRSTLCRSGKSEIKRSEAGNCWWQMSASSGNSNYIDCRLRQASTTCARDLTTWQGVWQRCLDYRAMPRHLSWLNILQPGWPDLTCSYTHLSHKRVFHS